MARRTQTNNTGPGAASVFVGAGGGGGGVQTYVGAEQLKQVMVPVETLLGAANGAITGAILSAIVSMVVTVASGAVLNTDGGLKVSPAPLFKNVIGNHLVGVISGTAIFAALGALRRFAHASKHNEWAQQESALQQRQLELASRGTYADQVDQGRDATTPGTPGRSS